MTFASLWDVPKMSNLKKFGIRRSLRHAQRFPKMAHSVLLHFQCLESSVGSKISLAICRFGFRLQVGGEGERDIPKEIHRAADLVPPIRNCRKFLSHPRSVDLVTDSLDCVPHLVLH